MDECECVPWSECEMMTMTKTTTSTDRPRYSMYVVQAIRRKKNNVTLVACIESVIYYFCFTSAYRNTRTTKNELKTTKTTSSVSKKSIFYKR